MRVRWVAAGVVALVALGCGYSIKSNTSYDKGVDFSAYHTFFMLHGNSSGDPLLDQRAATEVETALANRGWVEAPAGEGRAAVVVHAATRTKHDDQSFYDGWGGWGWGGQWLGATTTSRTTRSARSSSTSLTTTKLAIWRVCERPLSGPRTTAGSAGGRRGCLPAPIAGCRVAAVTPWSELGT